MYVCMAVCLCVCECVCVCVCAYVGVSMGRATPIELDRLEETLMLLASPKARGG